MIRIFGYLTLFVIGLIVQFVFTKYFALYGIAPNFLLLAVLFVGIKKGAFPGQVLGFSWGLSWDVLAVDLFGVHAFLFTCVGFFSGKLSRKWDEGKVGTQMVVTGFASITFLIGLSFLYMLFGENNYTIKFNYIAISRIVLNMLLAPLVFKIGEVINAMFGSRHSLKYNIEEKNR
ncbi:rod shape-determining protein MreD [Elusimicrobiota bacterium]